MLVAGAMLPLVVSVSANAQSPGTGNYRALPYEGPMPPRNPPPGGNDVPPEAQWCTIDSGGVTMTGPNGLELSCTTGQPDAGLMSSGALILSGGFWPLPESAIDCYANCDLSSLPPILNVNNFQCFLNLFAAQSPRANCDESTASPVLNINDFQCFLNKFATGCT